MTHAEMAADVAGTDEIEELMNDKQTLVSIMGKMILLCDQRALPLKPFFTRLVIRSAMESFTSGANVASRQQGLWAVGIVFVIRDSIMAL